MHDRNPRPAATDCDFLSGGWEMGARMRSHDWSRSPLGEPETWSQPLRMLVRMILNAKQPMFIAWGPDLAFLYNETTSRSSAPSIPTRSGAPSPWSGRYCQLGADEAELPRAQPSREYTSVHEGNTGRIAPGEEGAIASSPVLTGRETMTAELEVIVDRSVNREKLLGLPD